MNTRLGQLSDFPDTGFAETPKEARLLSPFWFQLPNGAMVPASDEHLNLLDDMDVQVLTAREALPHLRNDCRELVQAALELTAMEGTERLAA
jgi:hypothetical protein